MTVPADHQRDARAVLIVSIGRSFGGVDVRVAATCAALADHPHHAVVLAGSELHDRLRGRDEPLVVSRHGRWSPRVVPLLVRTLRRDRPVTVDAHNVQSQLWAALAARLVPGTRLVATMHSAYSREYPTGPRHWLFPQVVRLCRLAGARFVAVSPAVADWLAEQGVPAGRVTLIENAIAQREDSQPAPRAEIGADAGALVVCAVGRLAPVKGHTVLLEALARLAPSEGRLQLVIVGEGPQRAELESLARSLGLSDRVTFTGFRRDVDRILAASDIFCMPSLSEGLPFALLEAASARLPIVASEVGGMAELLAGTGAARLVPPGDPDALARALGELAADPEARRRLGAAGAELVQSRYSAERWRRETLEVLGVPETQTTVAAA